MSIDHQFDAHREALSQGCERWSLISAWLNECLQNCSQCNQTPGNYQWLTRLLQLEEPIIAVKCGLSRRPRQHPLDPT